MSLKLPEEFLKSIKFASGFDEKSFVDAHTNLTSITSVRINPKKYIDKFDAFKTVPWTSLGRLLPERPVFIADPYFHAGCYYVQEASSMFLEHILKRQSI